VAACRRSTHRSTDERNHPGRPWAGHLAGPPSATGDELVAAMDAVGVDAALLVSSFSLYRRWCMEAAR
jgi:hypothetical protein